MRIERITPPSRAAFRRDYQEPCRPVILTGLMEDWPARRWTLESLRQRYGDRTVKAVRVQRGEVVHSARDGIPYDTIGFGEYLDQLQSSEPPRHYMIFPISDVLPELIHELVLPEYCRDAPWFRARFWLSGANTRSPLHRDPPDNLFAQIFGRKRFILYRPEDAKNLYPHRLWSGLP
ncbi:MAG: cupin-like domain-containing protein, partial [Minicystis sp.]